MYTPAFKVSRFRPSFLGFCVGAGGALCLITLGCGGGNSPSTTPNEPGATAGTAGTGVAAGGMSPGGGTTAGGTASGGGAPSSAGTAGVSAGGADQGPAWILYVMRLYDGAVAVSVRASASSKTTLRSIRKSSVGSPPTA